MLGVAVLTVCFCGGSDQVGLIFDHPLLGVMGVHCVFTTGWTRWATGRQAVLTAAAVEDLGHIIDIVQVPILTAGFDRWV